MNNHTNVLMSYATQVQVIGTCAMRYAVKTSKSHRP